jgi:hypothetical protein
MSSDLRECCGQMMRGRCNVGYMRVTPPTGIVYSCEGVKGLRNVTWIYIMGSIFFSRKALQRVYIFSFWCRFFRQIDRMIICV